MDNRDGIPKLKRTDLDDRDGIPKLKRTDLDNLDGILKLRGPNRRTGTVLEVSRTDSDDPGRQFGP